MGLVVLSTIALVAVAASYGWRLLGRHHAMADRCQVVGQTTGVRYSMDPEQLLNASIVADLAMRRALPQQAVIVALATTLQESKLRNLSYGDRDSVGLFQQRPSQGWGAKEKLLDPVYASGKFFDALIKVPNWESLPVAAAAQAVQRSGFPDAYASWQQRATAMAAALTGTTSSQLTCALDKPGVDPKATQNPSSPVSPQPAGDPNALPLDRAVVLLTDGLAADLVVTSPAIAAQGTKVKTITVSGLAAPGGGGDPEAKHRTATVSAWALAHSRGGGITKVALGDKEWRPDRVGWQTARTIAAPGTVVITVALR